MTFDALVPRQQQWCVNNLLGFNSGTCWSDCYSIPIPCYGYALNMISQKAWTYPGTLQNPNWTGPLTASNIHSKLSVLSHYLNMVILQYKVEI